MSQQPLHLHIQTSSLQVIPKKKMIQRHICLYKSSETWHESQPPEKPPLQVSPPHQLHHFATALGPTVAAEKGSFNYHFFEPSLKPYSIPKSQGYIPIFKIVGRISREKTLSGNPFDNFQQFVFQDDLSSPPKSCWKKVCQVFVHTGFVNYLISHRIWIHPSGSSGINKTADAPIVLTSSTGSSLSATNSTHTCREYQTTSAGCVMFDQSGDGPPENPE